MKSSNIQDEYKVSKSPNTYQQRPLIQNEQFREGHRYSQKHQLVMVNDKENTQYKQLVQQQYSQQKMLSQGLQKQNNQIKSNYSKEHHVRPSSSSALSKHGQQHQLQPQFSCTRPYSSSHDKRQIENSTSKQSACYLSTLQQTSVPSAPLLKKPVEILSRGSIKKEFSNPAASQQNLKNSLILSQMGQQSKYFSHQSQYLSSYSQQKRLFSNQPETGIHPNQLSIQNRHASVDQSINYQFQFKQGTPKVSMSKGHLVESFIEQNQKTETEDNSKRSHDYQEYRKLQDKLQYLENKIISIKSNIDNNNQALINKNSGRFIRKDQSSIKPKGLTAKFFGNRATEDSKKVKLEKVDRSVQFVSPPPPLLPKQQENLICSQKPKHKQEQSSPSLSQFITQVKANPDLQVKSKEVQQIPIIQSTQQKIIVKEHPSVQDNVKQLSIINQSNKLSNRKGSSTQDLQKYPSMSSLLKQEIKTQEPQFLYYISSLIRAYMSTDTNKVLDQTREHLIQTIQAIQFSKQMRQTPIHMIEERKSYLPKKEYYKNKKTLIFDLDETLIHCNESAQVNGDVYLPIRFPTGELIEASVNIRPYAQQILENLSQHFEIIVFTASHSCYANVVLDHLDPGQKWVSHRLFRESCVQTEEGAYIKDLRVIANRSLSDVLLIDNAAYSFGLQIPNGVPILPFYECKKDQELIYLQNYLLQFKNVKDMRDINSRQLKVDMYSDFNDPIEFLQTLFKENIPMQN